MTDRMAKLETEVDGRRKGLEIVPLRHPLRWVMIVLVSLVGICVLQSFVTNENYQWGIVGKYFFSGGVLEGLVTTIELTAIAMVIGIVCGLILAFMRLSESKFLRGVSAIYIWFFRGIPPLVLLIVVYNISFLYPKISIGVPFGPQFISVDTNDVVTPLLAAIVVLGFNEAAFMCEVIRGGLLSVDKGQLEAAQTLGMPTGLIRRRIVVPQAMRTILPPTGNNLISLLKSTSLVSVIASSDLLYSVQAIYTRTYETIPLLTVATIWYLIVTSALMVVQHHIERWYSRGSAAIGSAPAATADPVAKAAEIFS